MPGAFAERLTTFTDDLASHPDAVQVLLDEMTRLLVGRLLAAADEDWTPRKLTAWSESIELETWQELAQRWRQDRHSFAEAEVVARNVADDLDAARHAIAMGLGEQAIRYLKRAEAQLTDLSLTRTLQS